MPGSERRLWSSFTLPGGWIRMAMKQGFKLGAGFASGVASPGALRTPSTPSGSFSEANTVQGA